MSAPPHRIFWNPQHVREVSKWGPSEGEACRIVPTTYSWGEPAVAQVYTHVTAPAEFAACIAVFEHFRKQRVAPTPGAPPPPAAAPGSGW